jgi:hypothetical protein
MGVVWSLGPYILCFVSQYSNCLCFSSGTKLSCGVHSCPSKCHQLSDHSKMECNHIMYSNCPQGHAQQWKCHKGQPSACATCDREKKIAEKKKQAEFALQEKRDAERRLHAQQIANLDDQIARQRDSIRDAQLAEERRHAIEQKEKDLKDAVAIATRAPSVPNTSSTVQPASTPQQRKESSGRSANRGSEALATTSNDSRPPAKSAARESWQHQKEFDGAVNDAIDAIMEMTGLEDVKQQVLRIKNKVDTSTRQNAPLKGERFNVSMLGNPGTGTVVRIILWITEQV